MNFDPVDLHHGSDITFTVGRWARDALPFLSVAHIAFAGTYRDGSIGTRDAHYISGIASIVAAVWRPSAIIIDFSELSYEWGDHMEILLPEDPRNALVVGEKCRRAMSTLQWGLKTDRDITELANVFDSFTEACRYVAGQLVDRWNDNIEHSDFLSESDRISLVDFGLGE